MSLRITKRNLLIVEGCDEHHFFNEFFRHITDSGKDDCIVPDDIQIIPLHGKDKLKRELKALSMTSEFKSVEKIGILQDADNDPKLAFNQIAEILKELKFTPPEKQMTLSGGNPSWIILINPMDKPGMLEDLIVESFSGDHAMKCVDSFHECILNARENKPKNYSKAYLQTYFSSNHKYIKDIGVAAKEGILNFEHEAFENLRTFIDILTS
ncbi:DUF3226 domain-containing protein [Methanoplanus endosymbiosus]|uniref:Uncharacterized protein n=1 Tax=Methanoplanus endosymbiosus TaxID=33865 RepID=A0A9E7THL4_9EURY|nr:DUF3226 domain-containing protein [Methanoplanus endosymbiosus]UUX93177.1 hypothetical protein L6E24_03380 [Methanoplanus endosymbiosus]